MRISDWSSDVCSSDLAGGEIRPTEGVSRAKEETPRRSKLSGFVTEGVMEKGADFGILSRSPLMKASGMSDTDDSQTEIEAIDARLRSEEHTSELQSLMRISYAVLCLKKKKKKQLQTHN